MKSFRGQPGFLAPSQPGENQAELSIKNLSLKWGGGFALNNIEILIRTSEVVALVGPKGAGKTSLIDCIIGGLKPYEGRIYFNNKDITGRKPNYIARIGISRTSQGTHIFQEMTVLSNLLVARHSFYHYNVFKAFFSSPQIRRDEIRNRGMAEQLLDLFDLQHVRKRIAGTLPYDIIKRLEIAMAISMEPKLLILDDPFTGISHEDAKGIKRILFELNKVGNLTMILSENDMNHAAKIADRIIVLDFGVKLAEGSPDFVRNHPKVIKVYPIEK